MSKMMVEEEVQRREDRLRKILNERYPSSPLLISVRAVAEILGIPHRTIYGQVKQKTFFIPHRIINRTLMVDVEDFVRWYADTPDEPKMDREEVRSDDPFKKAMLDILRERDLNPAGWLQKMEKIR